MGNEVTELDDRRSHERRRINTAVTCHRMGRGGFDEEVETLDLSPGGTLLLADRRLGVGDVLALEFDADGLGLRIQGMVVGVRDAPFKGMHARYVHVAFTSLSAERLTKLARAIAAWGDDPEIA